MENMNILSYFTGDRKIKDEGPATKEKIFPVHGS
jgi:hypothetical protein